MPLFTRFAHGIVAGVVGLTSACTSASADDVIVDRLSRVGIELSPAFLKNEAKQYRTDCINIVTIGGTCAWRVSRLTYFYVVKSEYELAQKSLEHFKREMEIAIKPLPPCISYTIPFPNYSGNFIFEYSAMLGTIQNRMGKTRPDTSLTAFLCQSLRDNAKPDWIVAKWGHTEFLEFVRGRQTELSERDVETYMDAVVPPLRAAINRIGRLDRWWGSDFNMSKKRLENITDAIKLSQLLMNASDASRELGLSYEIVKFLENYSAFFSATADRQVSLKGWDEKG